ncbi:MAG: bifunctional lysylphosphatidylglycerol flippase/synthetase MprF [Candidatus Brocadia sp.]|jgi:phosphatidylglycerol lysyltransferase
MGNKFLRNLSPFFGILLFTAALWVLHYELKEYCYHDMLRQLKALPTHRLLLALLFTSLGYLTLIGYDFLALYYVNHPLGYGKIATAGFIGYAFSNNIGVSMLAAVRYRLYSSWGLSPVDITKVVAFCGLAFWLGIFTVGGMLFLIEPFEIPPAIRFRFVSLPYLGILFLVFITGYLTFSALKKKPLKIFRWEFSIPSLKFSLFSIVIACLDVMLNGSVLYVLLPFHENLSYPKLLGIFVLSQIAGLVSQVPGGLGIIETVTIFFLSPIQPVSAILGSLLAFRAIYYLLPMCFAAALLGLHEFLQRKEAFKLIARIFGQWVPEIVPSILSFTTFVGGAILLFSGSVPAEKIRMLWIKDIITLPIMEVSHFFGSLVGILLLILAWGLQRRLNAAYPLTVGLLIAGIVFSLLKGFDYEEATILAFMLGVLLPSRRHFYRKTSLINEPFTPGWIAAIVFVMLCSVWLGFFSYKHIEYSDELWWHFSLSGDAPRSLRATVGAGVLALCFAVFKLLRPAFIKPLPPRIADLDTIRSIVNSSKDTYANLALLGDKSFLFSERRNAFIMYAINGRSWVAFRDPVGPENEMSELIWKFWEMCDRHDGWTVFYEVNRRNLHIYIDLGLTLLKLGEEARVSLTNFSLEGKAYKGLRHINNRLKKEGCIFELIPAAKVPSLLQEFKIISDTWLAEKNITEKGFCTGFFDAEYLKNFPAGIVRKNDKIIAFVNIWQGAEKEELSVDLMRYLPDAPNGVMEYLFIQLMLWGKQNGYQWFNLGMAPLSGLEEHALAPLWNRLGALIFRHGEHFFNFQGLRQYKEKFDPEWEPKYLASPGGLKLPRILTNIAFLISRGTKGVVAIR